MSAYFVTAIGTGVGKTFTSCALLHAARVRGVKAQGYKPVISGWVNGDASMDTLQMIDAMGAGDVASISPWRFAAPLSPHRAAALEGNAIDFDALVAWSRTQVDADGMCLIEGVGGVMVPLTDTHTTLDWMRALNLPVILVVGTYLGSISHTLTALAVLKQAGLRVAALVMNESAGSSVTLAEAEAGLAPFVADIPLRVVQPLVSSWKEAHAIHALVEQFA